MAAALAGRVARVISTDLSPAMVEAARRREIPKTEHRVMDMQAIELEDASVDAVVCRFGYMLAPDRARALRETRRVLRPGGRLAFATWAPANRNPWATAYGPVLIERGLQEPPNPDEPGQFSFSATEQIEPAVRASGFEEVVVEEVGVVSRYDSWSDYRHVITSLAASLRATLEQLDERARAEIDEAAQARIEGFRVEDGYVLPGVALVTSAR